MSLERLITISQASDEGQSLTGVADLIGEGAYENHRHGISGVLALRDGRFLQVSEGPSASLDALMRRLETDPRRLTLEIVCRHPIQGRRFARWSLLGPLVSPDLDAVFSAVRTDVDAALDGLKALIPQGA